MIVKSYEDCVKYTIEYVKEEMSIGLNFDLTDGVSMAKYKNEKIGYRSILDNKFDLVESANKDSNSFDQLLFGAALMLERNQELPVWVNYWIIDFLRGNVKSPPRKKGKKIGTRHKILVWNAVENLRLLGFKPTRSTGPQISGCDAVADALTRLKLTPQTYEGVKSIWLEWNRVAKRFRG